LPRRDAGDQLFFASLISAETIAAVFGKATAILDSARVWTTAVTVWTFLSQVLSADHGCVQAVAKLIAYRLAGGLSAPSAETGAYCIARDKLDEQAMHALGSSDQLCDILFACCQKHTAGRRGACYEPRVVKRRAKALPAHDQTPPPLPTRRGAMTYAD